jgi:hypothetical protein
MTLTPLTRTHMVPVRPSAVSPAATGLTNKKAESGLQVTQIAIDMLTPIGAGIVAEQLYKSTLKRGSVPAALIAFAGAAAVKSLTDGTVQVARNKINGDDWHKNLQHRMVNGAFGGAVVGAMTLLGPRLQKGIARTVPGLSPTAQVAASSFGTGFIGASTRAAVDQDTWKEGFAPGLLRMAVNGTINGSMGACSGGLIKTITSSRFMPKVKWLPYPFNA